MPRIRTIKPEFFSHEELASKSAHARLLAIGLLTLADCEGRLRWVPMQVHAQVFPWEAPGEAFENIEVLLGELIDVGYVLHYEADGKRYVEIVNFTKHQRISGKEAAYKSRLPGPPGKSQKPNDLRGETREAMGKHPDASPGSSGEPLGTEEQRNQRNRGTEEINSTSAGRGPVDPELAEWLVWWNTLRREDPPLVPCGVTEDQPSQSVLKAWRCVLRDGALRKLATDRDAIEREIRASSFVRDAGWFRPEKVLAGKNRDGEWIVKKLLDGGFRDELPKSRNVIDDSRNTRTTGIGTLYSGAK